MAAARAWAAGSLDAATPRSFEDDEVLADARRFGASAAELAGLRQILLAGQADALSVWADNAPVVAAFVVTATQWRTALDLVDGRMRLVWIGLDYAGAKVSIEQSGMTISPALWTGLRIMEAAARDALNGDRVH